MKSNAKKKSNIFLGLLITGISLSTAGSMMSLISISTLLFKIDITGTYSSWLQVVTLFGVVITGIFGGYLINKIAARSIGFFMPIFSAVVLLWLLFIEIKIFQGLTVIFLLSCFYGVEHPNNSKNT